jgi:hypothetical protein
MFLNNMHVAEMLNNPNVELGTSLVTIVTAFPAELRGCSWRLPGAKIRA